ncbi:MULTISPECIES: amino acid permease [Heyndrickxia]|uniref:Amino acid permease-associated region n=1 Tax=Heyndrickxia coagulans 36D1 TaxID=345219 RepID=G2TK72_HEYCO|nr:MULTISPECIES: amino acid permease [Heyndrickxia]AEP01073.1 amino acid permease-associated region [Heyndrickxia coagulans 36D1]AWP38202.1 amino acid permease [Heyndrickxia coagulans]MEC2304707.1 amino acid permease [Weizmannia sp. CD-2023]MEC2340956.1 amino acid permease [Weizmannia sp. CD-2023]QDI60514.1 amino acid permease [Heyndrickxia coagulans]
MEKNQHHLQKGLSPRHVQFIALAGMIGTGIFKGSSDTVSLAGPSVAVSYLIGGALLFIVMSALGEMALVHPGLNVQNLIHKAFGSRVSFIIGWLYWINWVIVTVVELLAAGSFLQFWVPQAPLWLLSLLCAAFVVGINLIEVKYYGEFEFWIAGIKIITLIVFILLGALILFGLFPGTSSTVSNYTAHGGFFPNGLHGTFSAFLIVMFSYGGAELIGVTVSETKDSEKVLPRVIKQTVVRVMLFYILPILVICGIIPWNQVSSVESPFVQVFSRTGIPAAAHVMNFVLLTAVLSAANSGIYATSRTLFNMAQSGEAPRAFLKISRKGVPLISILLTSLFILAGVILAYLTPDEVISYLMTIPGFTVVLVWTAICAAELRLRKSYAKLPSFRVKGYPFMVWIALLALAGIFLSFLLGGGNPIGTSVCLAILIVLVVLSLRIKAKE